jgi:hypothetical protein
MRKQEKGVIPRQGATNGEKTSNVSKSADHRRQIRQPEWIATIPPDRDR